MFQQIISHTPTWVWFILAFLIYRGLLASRDRELSLRAVAVIPLVMLALSIQGIVSGWGLTPLSVGSWVIGASVGATISWSLVNESKVRVLFAKSLVFVKGSWAPLTLMMGIFLMKYAVNVALAIHADWRTDNMFIVAVCALYGVFNGLFLGRLLRIINMYRQQAGMQALTNI